MADQKVSDLPSLNGADVDAADLLYIVDSSAGLAGSKKITVSQYQVAPYSGAVINGVPYFDSNRVIASSAALTFDGTSLTTTGSVSASSASISGLVSASSASISGLVHSTSSGFRFPDNTTQTTAFVNPIPSGTVMLFVQTSAPTGWTKSTTHDNKALRVVSGSVSSGGSVAFTTAFASQTPSGSISVSTSVSGTVGSTTLTTTQMPTHNHPATAGNDGSAAYFFGSADTNLYAVPNGTGNAGGSGSHDHSFSGSASSSGSYTRTAINLAVQYVDVIIATKN